MPIAQTDEPIRQKALRLWPGVAAVVLQCVLWFVVPIVAPEAAIVGLLGGLACGLVVLVWWLFFNRAHWSERVGAIVLMVVALFATKRIVHESIAGGMMGMMLPMYAIPVLSFALVSWAVASRRLSSGPRRAAMVATILLACGVFALLRTGGLTGDADSDFHWRWTKTPEERLLAQAGTEQEKERVQPPAPAAVPPAALPPTKTTDQPVTSRSTPARVKETLAPAADPLAPSRPEWPGFRGPGRDSIIRGVRIDTDWSRSKPV